jgi:hypothetical protein
MKQLGPGSYDINETQTGKRVIGGRFLQGKRPEIALAGEKKSEELGPGTYDLDKKPIGEKIKVQYLKEYYKELALLRDQQKQGSEPVYRDVLKRRDAIKKAEEDVRIAQEDELLSRLDAIREFQLQKAPFNSTSERGHDVIENAKASNPGPGSYNAINKTIMEGYIRTTLTKEKVKVDQSKQETRV